MQVSSPRFSGVHIIHEQFSFPGAENNVINMPEDQPMQSMLAQLEEDSYYCFTYVPPKEDKTGYPEPGEALHKVTVFFTENDKDETVKSQVVSAIQSAKTQSREETHYFHMAGKVPYQDAEKLARIVGTKMGLAADQVFEKPKDTVFAIPFLTMLQRIPIGGCGTAQKII